MIKYVILLVIFVMSSLTLVAQSDPSDLFPPSPDSPGECPILEFATEEQVQELWQVIAPDIDSPEYIIAIYGEQIISLDEIVSSETELSCSNWEVWQIVDNFFVKSTLDNCDGIPTLTTYASGIYWLSSLDLSDTITDETTLVNLPPNTVAYLGSDSSGNYSLVVHRLSEDVIVVDIWDHVQESFINMLSDLQGIEAIDYTWRADTNELTILARYTFDQQIVMLNYNPVDQTFYTFVESSNNLLSCSYLRWENPETLYVGSNQYFDDLFQVQTISFPDLSVNDVDSILEDLREIFIEFIDYAE